MCVAVVVVVVVWWCSRAVVALSHLAPRPSPPAFSFVAGPWGVGRLGCRLSRRPPPARPVRPTPRRRPLATGLFLFSRPDGGRQPVPPPAEVLCAPAVPVWGWKSSGRSPGVLGGRRVRLSLLTPPYAPLALSRRPVRCRGPVPFRRACLRWPWLVHAGCSEPLAVGVRGCASCGGGAEAALPRGSSSPLLLPVALPPFGPPSWCLAVGDPRVGGSSFITAGRVRRRSSLEADGRQEGVWGWFRPRGSPSPSVASRGFPFVAAGSRPTVVRDRPRAPRARRSA